MEPGFVPWLRHSGSLICTRVRPCCLSSGHVSAPYVFGGSPKSPSLQSKEVSILLLHLAICCFLVTASGFLLTISCWLCRGRVEPALRRG